MKLDEIRKIRSNLELELNVAAKKLVDGEGASLLLVQDLKKTFRVVVPPRVRHGWSFLYLANFLCV